MLGLPQWWASGSSCPQQAPRVATSQCRGHSQPHCSRDDCSPQVGAGSYATQTSAAGFGSAGRINSLPEKDAHHQIRNLGPLCSPRHRLPPQVTAASGAQGGATRGLPHLPPLSRTQCGGRGLLGRFQLSRSSRAGGPATVEPGTQPGPAQHEEVPAPGREPVPLVGASLLPCQVSSCGGSAGQTVPRSLRLLGQCGGSHPGRALGATRLPGTALHGCPTLLPGVGRGGRAAGGPSA